MRSNEIEQYKRTIRLNTIQRSIIVGTLLGDGHLESQNNRKTYRLKIEHSAKQLAYVLWLYKNLQFLVQTPPQSKRKVLNKAEYENYYFQTLSLGQLRFYGQQFYNEKGHKQVPRQIKRWLSPLALAIWFMDDGSIKSMHHKALIFNTQCFSRKDVIVLQNALILNFNIESKIRKQKEGPQILVVGRYAERLVETIRPYVLSELTYKFGLLE